MFVARYCYVNVYVLGVSSLNKATEGTFAVPFRVLSRTKYDERKFVALESVSLRGAQTFQATPTKKDLGTS